MKSCEICSKWTSVLKNGTQISKDNLKLLLRHCVTCINTSVGETRKSAFARARAVGDILKSQRSPSRQRHQSSRQYNECKGCKQLYEKHVKNIYWFKNSIKYILKKVDYHKPITVRNAKDMLMQYKQYLITMASQISKHAILSKDPYHRYLFAMAEKIVPNINYCYLGPPSETYPSCVNVTK
jgi:hypothetical protein